MKITFKIITIILFSFCASAQNQYAVVASNQALALNEIDVLGEHNTLSLRELISNHNPTEKQYILKQNLTNPKLFYFLNIGDDSINYFFLFPNDSLYVKFNADSVQQIGSHKEENQVLQIFNTQQADLLFGYEGGTYSWITHFGEANKNSQRLHKLREKVISDYESKVRPGVIQNYSALYPGSKIN